MGATGLKPPKSLKFSVGDTIQNIHTGDEETITDVEGISANGEIIWVYTRTAIAGKTARFNTDYEKHWRLIDE